MHEVGFEPTKRFASDLKSDPLTNSVHTDLHKARFELARLSPLVLETNPLTTRCTCAFVNFLVLVYSQKTHKHVDKTSVLVQSAS